MTSEHNSGELDEPCSEDNNPESERTDELIRLVEEGIEETFQEFEEYPQMFSTEADVKLRLFKNIGSKNYRYKEGEESELWGPHTNAKSSWIRSEWKRAEGDEVWSPDEESDEDRELEAGPIDLMLINAGKFKIEHGTNSGSKRRGKYGKAPAHVVIEIKGPQIHSECKDSCTGTEIDRYPHTNQVYCDIKKVSNLLESIADYGYVLVFHGDDANLDEGGLEGYTNSLDEGLDGTLKFRYSRTDVFSEEA